MKPFIDVCNVCLSGCIHRLLNKHEESVNTTTKEIS